MIGTVVPAWGGGKRRSIMGKVQLAHSYEEIISVENLLEAWKEFVRGKRAKRDVQEFSLRLMDNYRTPSPLQGEGRVRYG
jgi:hypothetical protein